MAVEVPEDMGEVAGLRRRLLNEERVRKLQGATRSVVGRQGSKLVVQYESGEQGLESDRTKPKVEPMGKAPGVYISPGYPGANVGSSLDAGLRADRRSDEPKRSSRIGRFFRRITGRETPQQEFVRKGW